MAEKEKKNFDGKFPPEPPKDENGNPIAPPEGFKPPRGERPAKPEKPAEK